MRTPIRSTPAPVERWMTRARGLRWLDALVGWLVLWSGLTGWPGRWPPAAGALVALAFVGLLAAVTPLRLHWRVVSGAVGLWVSRKVVAGDRAWCVGPSSAKQVIVTARHGARMTVVMTGNDATEGLTVRRTRVLILAS